MGTDRKGSSGNEQGGESQLIGPPAAFKWKG